MPDGLLKSSPERETNLNRFHNSNSPSRQVSGINDDAPEYVYELTYTLEMPNGGYRELLISDKDGRIELEGEDPALGLADGDSHIDHTANISDFDQCLSHFPYLSNYHGRNYDELDELVLRMEEDAGVKSRLR